MYIAIIGSLISAVGFGLANVVIKKSLENTSVGQTLIFSNSVGLVLLVLISFITNQNFLVDFQLLLILTAFAIGEFVLYLTLYKAFDNADITIAAALLSTYPIFSTLVSIFILNEGSSRSVFLIIIMIVFGALLTGLDWNDGIREKGKGVFVKGLSWVAITLIIHALYFPLLGKLTSEGSWQISLMYIKLIGIPIYLIYFLFIRKVKIIPTKDRIFLNSFIGFLEIIGWVGIAYASSQTSGAIAIIVALGSSAPIVTAIFARILFKEKIHIVQYLGIGVTFAAMVILTLIEK